MKKQSLFQKKSLSRRLTGLLTAAGLTLALLLGAGCAAANVEAEATGEAETETAAEAPQAAVTAFTFSDSGVAVQEGAYSGYEIEGTALAITAAGEYSVSGSSKDGSITVKKGVTGVTLILDGLELTSKDSAPICCNKSTEVTIVAAAGSVNDLTDTEYNNDETYPDNLEAENAVIKTKDGSQVLLTGSGTINVYAYGKNGVKGGASTETEGEASLTLEDLTLNVYAYAEDGVKSDQELNLLSGNITVEAADDGIKSDYVLNIGAEGTKGPVIRVNKSYEGMEGATINIYSGDISVIAEEDGINAANSDLVGYSYELNILGGTVYVDAATGDGLDSNGKLNISDGAITVFAAPSGSDNTPLDSETGFTLSGGTALAVGSSMMTELPASSGQSYVVFGSGGGFGGPGSMPGGMGGGPGGEMPGGMGGGPGGEMPGSMPGAPGGEMPGSMPGTGGVSLSAGDSIAILAADGSTLMEATAKRTADYVFFTCPDLTSGQTYSLSVNGTVVAAATAS